MTTRPGLAFAVGADISAVGPAMMSAKAAVTGLTGAMDRLGASGAMGAKAISGLDVEAKSASAATERMTRHVESLRRATDPAYRSAAQLAEGERLLAAALGMGTLSAGDHTRALAALTAHYGQAEAAADRLAAAERRRHAIPGGLPVSGTNAWRPQDQPDFGLLAAASAFPVPGGGVTERMAAIGKAARLADYEVKSLSYQLNDVVMGLSTGQSPFMVMMQQGAQVSQVLGGVGVRGAIAGIGTAMASLVNPVTLTMGALLAGGYALSVWMDDGEEAAKTTKTFGEAMGELDRVLISVGAKTEDQAAKVRDMAAAYRATQFAAIEAAKAEVVAAEARLKANQALLSRGRENTTPLGMDAAGLRDAQATLARLEAELKAYSDRAREAETASRSAQDGVAGFTASLSSLQRMVPGATEPLDKVAKRAEVWRIYAAGVRDLDASMEDGRAGAAKYAAGLEKLRIEADRALLAIDDPFGGNAPRARPNPRLDLTAEADEVSRLTQGLDDLALSARAAPMDEFSRKVFDTARSLGVARADLEAFIAAIYSGDLASAPAVFGRIADSLRAADNFARLRRSLDEMPSARLKALGEYQDFLNDQLAQGVINAEEFAAALADAAKGLDGGMIARMDELRGTAKGVLSGIRQDLEAGASAGEALSNALGRVLDRLADEAENTIIDKLLGEKGTGQPGLIGQLLSLGGPPPLTASAPAAGGGLAATVAGWLGLGGAAGPGGAVPAATGVMHVTAGTVMLSGGTASDGLLGQLMDAVTGGGAGKGAPAALTGGSDVKSRVWDFFASKGLQPHQVAGILGNVDIESRFNPTAVGDAGTAFGLFQHRANRGGGLGILGDVDRQLNLAWSELQTTEAATLRRLQAAPNVRGATEAFLGFERPRGYSLGNPSGSMHYEQRLASATAALERFGAQTSTATDGLTSLGSGLGQTADRLLSSASGIGRAGDALAGSTEALPGLMEQLAAELGKGLDGVLGALVQVVASAGGGGGLGGGGLGGGLLSLLGGLFGLGGGHAMGSNGIPLPVGNPLRSADDKTPPLMAPTTPGLSALAGDAARILPERVTLPERVRVPAGLRNPVFGGGMATNVSVRSGDVHFHGSIDRDVLPDVEAMLAQSRAEQVTMIRRQFGEFGRKQRQLKG